MQDQVMQLATYEAQEAGAQDILLTSAQESCSTGHLDLTTDAHYFLQTDQAQIRQQISTLQITPNFTPRKIPADANTPVPVLQHKKKKKRRASIEWTADVLYLAVRVIDTIQLWNVKAREVMKVMEARNRGVGMFVQNMAHQFGVHIQSKPVWGTIENAVNKVLDIHQVQRNKEKNKITGGGDADGDELESDEKRRKRMFRERFYDKMLGVRAGFKEWRQVFFYNSFGKQLTNRYLSVFNISHLFHIHQKKKSKNKAEKRKAEQLVAAGKHTMNAAIGNLAKRMRRQADGTDGTDGQPDKRKSMSRSPPNA